MTRETVELEVPDRHVTGGIGADWMAVRTGDEVLVVHEPGDSSTTVYTIEGTTKNPRVMAGVDAVMWEGSVGLTSYEDGLLLIQHQFAGIEARLPIGELLDEAVPTLERTTLVGLKGVGGRVEFKCSDCGKHVERERHKMDIPGMTPQRCTSCTFDKMGGGA